MLSWNGKNYFVGNVYVKLDCLQGVKDMLQMLDHTQTLSQIHRCSGVILMGDFNARHQLWNDNCINSYGKYIESNFDWTKFCVHDPGRPTFLAKNGNSLIDFNISTTALDPYLRNTKTDNEAILFSGAPLRGHVPVSVELHSHYKAAPSKVEHKFDIVTMNWDGWSLDIEQELVKDKLDALSHEGEIHNLMALIDNVIGAATKANCESKKVCKHSKPGRKNLQLCRLSYGKHSKRTLREIQITTSRSYRRPNMSLKKHGNKHVKSLYLTKQIHLTQLNPVSSGRNLTDCSTLLLTHKSRH